MDGLGIQIEQEDSQAANDGVSVFVEVMINGEKLDDVLDVDEFFQSICSRGLRPLFTCGCGNFGCGGYYVEVEPAADAWVLRNRYDPLDQHLISVFEYRLPWQQVWSTAQRIIDVLAHIHAARPQAEIFSGVYGANIADRIEYYAGRRDDLK